MNDAILIQLKILVERAVRPVTASTARKRKIREELLAHVSGVFEEELARLGDERAASERTALRFGNPAEVTRQLQESVPAGDGFVRFWEGQPDESALASAFRFAWIETAIILAVYGVTMVAVGWDKPWSREELLGVPTMFAFVWVGPLWFLFVALVTHWLENSLHSPEPLTGWPRVGLRKAIPSAWALPATRIALIIAGLCLFLLLCIRGANWSTLPAAWDGWTQVAAVVLLAVGMMAATVLVAWILVQFVDERRRRHAEWANLPMDGGTPNHA
jgi:hypothetical protein